MPDHLAAGAASPARHLAERQPGQPPARDQRKGPPAVRPRLSGSEITGSQSGAGGGASSRQRARTCSSASSRSEHARLGQVGGGQSSSRWPSTGRNSRSMSSGIDIVAPLQQRPGARACARASGFREPTRRARPPRPRASRARVPPPSAARARRCRRPPRRAGASCSSSVSITGLSVVDRMAVTLGEHDRDLLVLERIAERGPHREPVELGLGQRKRALLVDRVLGRDHEERRRQRSRHSVDGHLALGHRLEQCRLRARHRAVDLVDEHHVGEHRSGAELELARPLVEDREAGDVRRLQVGRALDSRERRALDRLGDRRAPGSSSRSRGRPRAARGRPRSAPP